MAAKTRIQAKDPGRDARRRWLFLALFLALGLTHGYGTAARYDRVKEFEGDRQTYAAMSQGQPLDQTLYLYRWRALTPWVVEHMNVFLPDVLTHYYQVDPQKVLRVRWALWNGLGGVCAAFFLLLMMEELGFSLLQAGVGGLLYATSFQVALDGACMLVDPWANAATVACLLLALRGSRWRLLLVFAIGMFVKETVVLVGAWILLMRRPRWFSQCLCLLPGLLAYLWFRFLYLPGGGGHTEFDHTVGAFFQPVHLAYVAVEFGLNFALLAPLALLGWRDSAKMPELRRMAPLLLELALIPVLLSVELLRPWFAGFPVFIPLAVLGLWRLGGFEGPVLAPAKARARH